jgi:hypothetical protein
MEQLNSKYVQLYECIVISVAYIYFYLIFYETVCTDLTLIGPVVTDNSFPYMVTS